MEINKNNYIVIMTDPKTVGNMGGKVAIQERKDEDGKPGKVEKFIDGFGTKEQIAENFIREGIDPKKIIINGQPATDVLELNQKKLENLKRAKVHLGYSGMQEMGKFSDAEVAEMNKTKTLPAPYKLVYHPKVITFFNGLPAGETDAQFSLTKLSEKKLKLLSGKNTKFTNKIPNDYEVINKDGKTYIKEKNTDFEKAKKTNTLQKVGSSLLFASIATVLVGMIYEVTKLAIKK